MSGQQLRRPGSLSDMAKHCVRSLADVSMQYGSARTIMHAEVPEHACSVGQCASPAVALK